MHFVHPLVVGHDLTVDERLDESLNSRRTLKAIFRFPIMSTDITGRKDDTVFTNRDNAFWPRSINCDNIALPIEYTRSCRLIVA